MQAVLDIDSKFRYSGVTGDLFTEETVDLTPDLRIDFHLMVKTATRYYRIPDAFQPEVSVETVRYRMSRMWPCLSDLNFDNILIAGGSISSLLSSAHIIPANDVDIFLYGLTPEQANDKVSQIIESIKECRPIVSISKLANVISIKVQESHYDDSVDDATDLSDADAESTSTDSDVEVNEATVDDTSDSIFKTAKWTKHCRTFEIQIILRIYSSISEILHGFDLGSSAVGYDGQHVYFTSLSQYSYANSVNIIDTTRRSTTYEGRLCKYLDRGFRILFPNLSKEKIQRENCKTIDMPYLSLQCKKARVSLDSDERITTWAVVEHPCASDYEQKGGRWITEVISGQFCPDQVRIMDQSRLIAIFNRSRKFVLDQYKRQQLATDTVYGLFGQEIAAAYLKDKTSIKDRISALELLDPHIIADAYIRHAKSHFFPIRWMTVTPATQLTSSFNPIIADPQEWYGKWFHDPSAPQKLVSPEVSEKPTDENLLCCVCYKLKSNKILVPCGHTQYCEECLKTLQFITLTKICCICCQKVKKIITVY